MSTDYCPLHDTMCGRVDELELTQKGRLCQDHEARIKALEIVSRDQRDDINKLKVIVYTGAGASAFVGSMIGVLISAFIKAHLGG